MRFIERTPEYLEQQRLRLQANRRKWLDKNPEAMERARQNWIGNNHDRILQKRRENKEKKTGQKVVHRGSVVITKEERRVRRLASTRKYWLLHKEQIKHKPYYGKSVRKQTVTPDQQKRRMERQKLWRKKNRDKLRAYYRKAYQNPQFAIRMRLSARVWSALRRRGLRKSGRTSQLIGCTWTFLKQYIESKFVDGMSWEGRYLWHIDHIKPCARFDLTQPEQQRACFHFSNLRPLWAVDNMRKAAKWQEAA